MTKEKKLQILDDLVARAEKITYDSKSDMECCEDDTKSFIRNAMPNDNRWIGRIESISWYLGAFSSLTQEWEFIEAWNDGKTSFIGVLNSIKSEIELYDTDEQPTQIYSKPDEQGVKSNKIFIVHGHNNEMKLDVARTVERLDLAPIILHEQPSIGSETIIEKFERLSQDVSFAIVLLSADDKMDDGKYRARQNVILELGYFIAKLGRENVVTLYDASLKIELPSDVSGVLYEQYDLNGAWKFKMAQALNAAEFNVDANRLI